MLFQKIKIFLKIFRNKASNDKLIHGWVWKMDGFSESFIEQDTSQSLLN
jgi:hypothetical protein